jgi:predicted RNase H-like nuclease (RuvC/YqgF family)
MLHTMRKLVQWILRQLKRATTMIDALRRENRDLQDEIAKLREEIQDLKQEVQVLRAADRLSPLFAL